MPRYTALVSLQNTSGLPEDWCTNTLHFDDHNLTGEGSSPDTLASDLADIYVAQWTLWGSSSFNQVDVRFYDLEDAQPRPIKGQATKPLVGKGSGGPREVALCLSFYSERNLPRKRGRIYCGPFASIVSNGEVPSQTSIMAPLLDMADGFAGLGGIDVDWCVYSPTDAALAGGDVGAGMHPVTDAWVDDAWDTVRSRGKKASQRSTRTTGA